MKKETHQRLRLDGAGRDGKWNRGCQWCLCAHILSLSLCLSTFFLSRWLSFLRRYCLSFSVCHIRSLSLPLHTHAHRKTELSLAYRVPLLLWSKAFMWCLGLKNWHLLLPLINHVSVSLFFNLLLAWSSFENLEMDKSLHMYPLFVLEWFVFVLWGRPFEENSEDM